MNIHIIILRLMICLYVNDLIFKGNRANMFEDFKKTMT